MTVAPTVRVGPRPALDVSAGACLADLSAEALAEVEAPPGADAGHLSAAP